MLNHFFPEITLHILVGSLGLAIGLVPMFSVKGSTLHKRSGKAFALLAFVVMLTAVIAIALRDKPTIAMLSRITLTVSYLLFSGYRALKIKTTGPNWFDALMATAVIVAAILLSGYAPPQSSVPIALANITLWWLVIVAAYDLSRHGWQAYWIARIAPTDHGVKMVAVFFGMLSAGAGNLLSAFQPWSIIIPNVLGVIVMTVFLLRYLRKSRPAV